MPIHFTQLAAIVHYELLMQWRRGSLRTIVGLLVILPVLPPLYQALAGERDPLVGPATLLELHTAVAVSNLAALIPVFVFIVPLLAVEIIPLDREYKVDELLGALPLTAETYLAGKLAAVWSVQIPALLLGALLAGIADWLALGPYRLGPAVALVLAGYLPLALFATATSVLLAAGRPSRRRALIVALVLVPLCLAVYVLLAQDALVAGLFRAAIARAYGLEALANVPDYPDRFSGPYLARLAVALGALPLVWWIAQAGQRRRASGAS